MTDICLLHGPQLVAMLLHCFVLDMHETPVSLKSKQPNNHHDIQ